MKTCTCWEVHQADMCPVARHMTEPCTLTMRHMVGQPQERPSDIPKSTGAKLYAGSNLCYARHQSPCNMVFAQLNYLLLVLLFGSVRFSIVSRATDLLQFVHFSLHGSDTETQIYLESYAEVLDFSLMS